MAQPSVSHRIAAMITAYLGPFLPRTGSVGATLNALRVRLETNQVNDDRRADLSWQIREAIRTEFFKIKYPAAPSVALLELVMQTELLLANSKSTAVPCYFPGNRVAVPDNNFAGGKRPGTTLQLRTRALGTTSTLEVLVHLDGQNGGGFRWVQTNALTRLTASAVPALAPNLAPRPPAAQPVAARPGGPRPAPTIAPVSSPVPVVRVAPAVPQAKVPDARSIPPPRSQPGSAGRRATAQNSHGALGHTAVVAPQRRAQPGPQRAVALAPARGAVARQRKEESKNGRPGGTLPAAQPQEFGYAPFVPDALRSVSPPPCKRIRRGLRGPLSLASGAVEDLALAMREKDLGNTAPFMSQESRTSLEKYTQDHGVGAEGMNIRVNGHGDSLYSSGPCGSGINASGENSGSVRNAPRARSVDGVGINKAECSPTAKSKHLMSPSVKGDKEDTSNREPLPRRQTLHSRRARTVAAVIETVYVAERILARRRNMACDGLIEYCVKWCGAPWADCSWESREALMRDVPGLVMDFDVRHPEHVSKAECLSRTAPQDEEEELVQRMARAKAREHKLEMTEAKAKKLNESPITVPTWFDSPILELIFCGMTLQIRPGEGSLVADNLIAREARRRRARFREEHPEMAERLFPLSKHDFVTKQRNEASAVVQANAASRRANQSRLIYFPRALGRVIRTELAPPVSRRDVKDAPPSWESYLMDLGLECVNWERDYAPDMPNASAAVIKTVEHARIAYEKALRRKGAERTARLVRERREKEPGGVAGSFTDTEWKSLARVHLADASSWSEDGKAVPNGVFDPDRPGPALILDDMSLGKLLPKVQAVLRENGNVMTSLLGTRVPGSESNTQRIASSLVHVSGSADGVSSHGMESEAKGGPQVLLRSRNIAFGNALASAMANQNESKQRVYDPVWCCWRTLA